MSDKKVVLECRVCKSTHPIGTGKCSVCGNQYFGIMESNDNHDKAHLGIWKCSKCGKLNPESILKCNCGHGEYTHVFRLGSRASGKSMHKTRQIIMRFLVLNGWEISEPGKDFISFYKENNMGIDMAEDEFVFIADEGDVFHLQIRPTIETYYTMLGYMITHNLIAMDFKRAI